MTPADAVRFDKVSVRRSGLPILNEVSAVVPRGGCTVIVGPNGAGNTTLLLALLGEVPYRGRLRRGAGGQGATSAPRIGYVPQRIALDRGMPLTVTEFLALGEQVRPLWLGVRRAVRRKAHELLRLVRAAHLADRRLGALSGGETQRVLLALALEPVPHILVLDEPLSGVDIEGEHQLLEMLDEIRTSYDLSIFLSTHDFASLGQFADKVILLNRRVLKSGPPDEVLSSPEFYDTFHLRMGRGGER